MPVPTCFADSLLSPPARDSHPNVWWEPSFSFIWMHVMKRSCVFIFLIVALRKGTIFLREMDRSFLKSNTTPKQVKPHHSNYRSAKRTHSHNQLAKHQNSGHLHRLFFQLTGFTSFRTQETSCSRRKTDCIITSCYLILNSRPVSRIQNL